MKMGVLMDSEQLLMVPSTEREVFVDGLAFLQGSSTERRDFMDGQHNGTEDYCIFAVQTEKKHVAYISFHLRDISRIL